jgi:hypothetical protein
MEARWSLIHGICTGHECYWARSVPEAFTLLSQREFDMMFLDFDLEDGQDTKPIARQIEGSKPDRPCVVIHSSNPIGVVLLSEILPSATVFPAAQLTRSNPGFSVLRQLLESGRYSESLYLRLSSEFG